MIEFSILAETERGVSETATLDFLRADFDLFKGLLNKIPWEAALKEMGVQEGWTYFKSEVLKAQERAVPVCRKTSRRGRSGLAKQGPLAGSQVIQRNDYLF